MMSLCDVVETSPDVSMLTIWPEPKATVLAVWQPAHPLWSELLVWTARCTANWANWANWLMVATVSSSNRMYSVGLSKLLQNDIWIFALKKKTHRFEPFEYLYLSIMSITGGQTIQGDITTCIGIFGLWYSLKPAASTVLNGLMSLHMNEASFFEHASYRAADKHESLWRAVKNT